MTFFVSGVIYLSGSLDYETKNQYILTVEAYDCGIPSRMTSTNVTIHVNDVNDNVPVITPQSAVVHVKENEDSQVLLQVILCLTRTFALCDFRSPLIGPALGFDPCFMLSHHKKVPNLTKNGANQRDFMPAMFCW